MAEKIWTIVTLLTGGGLVGWAMWAGWNLPADVPSDHKGWILFALGGVGFFILLAGILNATFAFDSTFSCDPEDN